MVKIKKDEVIKTLVSEGFKMVKFEKKKPSQIGYYPGDEERVAGQLKTQKFNPSPSTSAPVSGLYHAPASGTGGGSGGGFCSQCGTKSTGGKFCASCGAAV